MHKQWLMIAVLSIGGCRVEDASHVQEAPDQYNTGNQMGLAGDYEWSELKDITSFESPLAWQGDSWVFTRQELADRWGAELAAEGTADFSNKPLMEAKLKDLWHAHRSDDQSPLFLSVAEKYDFLLGAPVEPTPEVAERVEAALTTYESEYQPDVELVEQEIAALESNTNAVNEQANQLYVEIAELQTALAAAQAAGDQAEIDRINALIEATTQELTSLYEQLAALWEEISETRKRLSDVLDGYYRQSRELASQLSSDYPLFANGWDRFMYYSTNYSSDWGWFGLCHGGAGASLYAPRTQRSVLAQLEGREVFLFEKDIRGLQVKAWANQRPAQGKYFVGRRCYHDDTELDDGARPIDGAICSDLSTRTCLPSAGGQVIYIVDNQISSRRRLEFKTELEGQIFSGRIERNIQRDSYSMAYADAQGVEQEVVLSIRKSCRDVNPLSLHLALTQHVAAGRGIVVDGSQAKAVWNAPVNGFELEYQSMQLITGEVSEPGELVPVDMIEDQLSPFRAEGTAYVLPVLAKLSMRSDFGDGISYEDAPEPYAYLNYNYTLEFDENEVLIGGEWGDDSITGSHVYKGMPDFIWLFPETPTLVDGPVDIGILNQIEACAQNDTDSLQKVVQVKGFDDNGQSTTIEKSVSYIPCPISR